MRLSPSFAVIAEQCLLRARWLRIDKLPTGDESDAPEPLRAGKALHQALQAVYEQVRASLHIGPLHTPDWLRVARGALDAAVTEFGPFEDDRIAKMRLALLDYLLDQHEVAAGDILGTEQFIQWSLKPGSVVIGFVDRIDRRPESTIVVIDYKSGFRRWHPDLVRSELQTQTYAAIVAQDNRWAQRIVVEIHMLDHREVASAVWTADDAQLLAAQLKSRYLGIDAAMADGPWNPQPGPWCQGCPFLEVCPSHGGTPPVGAWDPALGRKRTAADDDQPALQLGDGR